MKHIKLNFLIFFALLLLVTSCTSIDIYEKTIIFSKADWANAQKPEFTFTISDTTASYSLFFVVRHHEEYDFNNIWFKISIKLPEDSVQTFQLEKILSTNKNGWLATGFNSIYEHRIPIILPNLKIQQSGNYKVVIEQIMREDPLHNILSVGLRVEKNK